MKKLKYKLGKVFPFTGKDILTTILILGFAAVLCAILKAISSTDSHVPLIFVLAVLLISLLTNGYAFGLLASVIAVFGVNYAFTYPYFQFNFSMTGYPLTFICSFAVSIITCTLTSRVRQSEQIRIEGEREKMRANLLRAISHDFRTPLTSIIGSINVVMEDEGSLTKTEKHALLSDAKSDAEWLINMVENLLSITRIGSGSGTDIHKESQAVEEIVGEAVVKFRRQYPNFNLEVRIPDELLMVPMDATLIEQVIINLLINAVIHGESATTASLSVSREKGYAVFRVEDNGVGISKDILPYLFEKVIVRSPNEHSDDATRNMGIGLTVCNAIVTSHGGYMSAKNLRPNGASVSFSLPLSKEDDTAVHDIGSPVEPEMEEHSYGDQAENTDH